MNPRRAGQQGPGTKKTGMLCILALVAAMFALAAAPAHAQERDAVETETLEQVVPTPTPDPCAGADADYTYACRPCEGDLDYQTDADYAYCNSDAIPSRAPVPEAPRRRPEVQALPAAQLALTGAEPMLVGLAGLGLLFAGTGLRLRTAVARSR